MRPTHQNTDGTTAEPPDLPQGTDETAQLLRAYESLLAETRRAIRALNSAIAIQQGILARQPHPSSLLSLLSRPAARRRRGPKTKMPHEHAREIKDEVERYRRENNIKTRKKASVGFFRAYLKEFRNPRLKSSSALDREARKLAEYWDKRFRHLPTD